MKKSFTLIELLVVISIIAILAGMLLPALGSAKSFAKTITCLSNQKQQIQAVQIYGNNYADHFPVQRQASNNYANWTWYQMLYEVMTGKDGRTFYYPKDGNVFSCGATFIRNTKHTADIYIEYRGLFCSEIGFSQELLQPKSGVYKKIGKAKSPGKIAVTADASKTNHIGSFDYSGGNKNSISGQRHNNKAVVSFVDGHAESVQAKQYLYPGILMWPVVDAQGAATAVTGTPKNWATLPASEKWILKFYALQFGTSDFYSK